MGGYGRAQQFPHSDIDLLVLLPENPDQALSAAVEQLIGALWDVGMEVGHSVRTLSECMAEAAGDITIETTLLENRWLIGNAQLHTALNQQLEAHIDPVAFLRPSNSSNSSGTINTLAWPIIWSPTSKKAPAACATCKPFCGSARPAAWATAGARWWKAASSPPRKRG